MSESEEGFVDLWDIQNDELAVAVEEVILDVCSIPFHALQALSELQAELVWLTTLFDLLEEFWFEVNSESGCGWYGITSRDARERICNCVVVAWDVLDGEVVLSEEFRPSCLSFGERGLVLEILESAVVGIDSELGA